MLFAYRLALSGIRALAPVLSRGESKLARHLRGRGTAHRVLTSWSTRFRDADRPLVWFHAPSVGEGRQAEAVMKALRRTRPELQTVFTYFSPSAESLGREIDADVATYLPWDLRGPVSEVLDGLRPDVVAFTKTEVWPVLAGACRERGIPTVLIAASVPPSAGRRRWLARRLLRRAWEGLAAAVAIGPNDAEGLRSLGVHPDRIHLMGDPGLDSALERTAPATEHAPWLTLVSDEGRPTWIAGSTWPEDEAVVLPALEIVCRAEPRALLILVPHEPEPHRVEALRVRCSDLGRQAVTLAEAEAVGTLAGADVLLVDRVGPLATLYSVSDVAYVGGGFGQRGLHSVLEPAAAACALLFGPLHHGAYAAAELLEAGGAKIAVDARRLGDQVVEFFADATLRTRAGQCARDYADRRRGGAEATARLLHDLVFSHRT